MWFHPFFNIIDICGRYCNLTIMQDVKHVFRIPILGVYGLKLLPFYFLLKNQ
jgi:hypothetical protein